MLGTSTWVVAANSLGEMRWIKCPPTDLSRNRDVGKAFVVLWWAVNSFQSTLVFWTSQQRNREERRHKTVTVELNAGVMNPLWKFEQCNNCFAFPYDKIKDESRCPLHDHWVSANLYKINFNQRWSAITQQGCFEDVLHSPSFPYMNFHRYFVPNTFFRTTVH